MFVITLCNEFATTTGLGGPAFTWLTWAMLDEAKKAAVELNAQHGLNAYIHPADRTDLTVDMVGTHTFGYDNCGCHESWDAHEAFMLRGCVAVERVE